MYPLARLMTLFAVSGMVYISAAQDVTGPVESPKARELYYHPEKVKELLSGWQSDANLTVTGLRYQIMLLRPGIDVAMVTDKYDFRVGDQFRILIETPEDTHVYVVHQSGSGQATMLYPDARSNENKSLIPAHTPCVLPPVGWYGFTQEGGAEELFIFASREPIKSLELPPSFVLGPNMWLSTRGDVVLTHAKSVEAGKTRDLSYVYEGLKVTETPAPRKEDPNVPYYKIKPQLGQKHKPSGEVVEPKKEKDGGGGAPESTPSRDPGSVLNSLAPHSQSPFRLASFNPQESAQPAAAQDKPQPEAAETQAQPARPERSPTDDRATPPLGAPITYLVSVSSEENMVLMHRIVLKFR